MSGPGNLYVISAPSGTGKTTLVKALVDSLAGITVSTSHTTRAKRPAEIEGVNYYFVNETEFKRMIAANEFLEYATVFDNFYGTSKRWVEITLKSGKDVILEIDWQGAHQIQQLFPNSVSVFILPPSVSDLQDRLIKRNQDKIDIIKQRIGDVRESTRHINNYDYVVINDDFTEALQDLKTIVQAGRLLQARQSVKYYKLINELSEANVDQL